MGVVRVVIPKSFPLRGVHPLAESFVHAARSRNKKAWQWAMEATAVVSFCGKTLVTLVSHSQPRWRGVTQGGVDPVFPFRTNPQLC